MACVENVSPAHRVRDGVEIEGAGRQTPRSSLGTRLEVLDLLAVVSSWLLAFALQGELVSSPSSIAIPLVGVVAVTVAALHHQHLYQSRVAMLRSDEVARIFRVALVAAAALVIGGEVAGVHLGPALIATGATATFVLLTFGRGRHHAWISRQRAMGNFARPVVVVGDSDEAAALIELFDESPELGVVPIGFAGMLVLDEPVPDLPLLGGPGDVVAAVRATGAGDVVISTNSMSSVALNQLVRDLHDAQVHVHLSSGISGIHHRRLHVRAVGHEPLIYVAPASLSRLELAAKRTLDVVGSVVGLVLALPVLLGAAIAVKLGDGGPVLFNQERVGRNGQPFTILKLRTMCVDAEQNLAELRHRNERQGPLFKLDDDPRVTPVGRFLRASSIDELPQLVNVLSGRMSLVGPRPALPEEVKAFDGRLIDRLQVKPGMTGLWQVEARDKPSFEAYRRLDLFYVENWSVWLDMAILFKTVGALQRRLRRSARRGRSTTSAPPATRPISTVVSMGAMPVAAEVGE